MFLVLELALLTIISVILYQLYKIFIGAYVISQPNEWMIVLRNGKVKKMGVGITSRVNYFESCVKFPSKIHKVSFRAEQVTKEMQGIEVKGVILWSVNPKNELPLKAVNYLGKDLTTSDATTAKDNLAEMCSAIVQHNIANSTIEEIQRERDFLRDSISKGISSVIEGWGCLVESVEITDVKILSSGLFANLQMKFREEERKKAELIRMATEMELKEKRLKNTLQREIQNLHDETKTQIQKNLQKIEVSKENLKMYKNQMKIDLANSKKSHNMKKKMLLNEAQITKRQNEEIAKLNLMKEDLKKDEETQRRTKLIESIKRGAEQKLQEQAIKMINEDFKNSDLLKEAQNKEMLSESNMRLLKLDMLKKLFSSRDCFSKIHSTSFGPNDNDPCLAVVERISGDIEALADRLTQ